MKQKRKMGMKLLSFLLTLAMVVGLMPGMGLTAHAAQVTETVTWDYATWAAIESGGTTNEITVTGHKAGGNLYNDATTVFNAPAGYVFTQIEFPTTYTGIGNGESANGGTFSVVDYTFDSTQDRRTVDGKKVTWTGESDTVSFTKAAYAIEYITFTMVGEGVDVESVTINHSEITLTVGGTETLTATVSPEDATDNTIIWSSDNESVATVADGVVTAVAKGTAIVKATATNGTEDTSDDDKTATCTITVEEPQKEEPAPDEPKEEEPAPDEPKEEETTPDTPATDTSINTEVKTAEGAPAIKADNLDNALAQKLLTDAEKAEYANGTPVLVYLDVKEVDKVNVPADDVTAIDKVTSESGYTYGDCLDISLWKKLGDGEASQVHDTNGNPIRMTLTVPDSLKAPAGYTRTIRVVRVHNGEATVLAEGTGLSLEISSDRFSSYFLVYKDTKIEEATNISADTSSNTQSTPAPAQTTVAEVPKTGQYMPIAALIMLILSMTGMVVVFTDLKKKNRI